MRIGIVGAGVAGLTLAAILSERGLNVTILDAANSLEPIGAGFTLQPNGLKVLAHVVDLDQLLVSAARVSESSISHWDGRPLDVDIMGRLSEGAESYSIHRGDLHAALLERLPKDVQLLLGQRVSRVWQEEHGACLETDQGVAHAFDVVIGADGARSVVRDFIDPDYHLDLGHGVAIRTLIPREEEETKFKRFQAWLGEGKVVLGYPVRHGDFLNIACYVESELCGDSEWSQPVDPGWLLEQFEGWDEALLRLLANSRECFSWRLANLSPLKNWTRGHVALVGDAAHAMVPYLGQGANQALMDVDVLAHCLLDGGQGLALIQDRLMDYQRKRMKAARVMQQLSAEAGQLYKERTVNNLNQRSEKLEQFLERVKS
ncbi:FAD-dependent monooxygenase [Corynebacterium sp. 320]|uniref:FAD-dependent monooxygenase n=1 Tax=Corynebacterium zhongnanshanii TaxID=2768834 RepID=A0ABQ6VHQ9_9CORY|nr:MULTISPECIES: NAD(P)/FAD-dependent oxidoreductase [Corynebacterium]KAB1504465.1 FAD-dependent monooxygenase [Corynebacterium sp. 320]KAB1552437.1 FAD-dependent monooxygenase [Corynebacterium sp. 321]KAB1554349.1 FAD-dependent monooxygenase [Corynebacterium sp. 319]KAB3522681.1 FAD-dependent monooxygenase [Corynebacterium zhongnanshanii]KAB3528601.1 FAD-dependent monooxygenase [Corynebacterium sp. 250]